MLPENPDVLLLDIYTKHSSQYHKDTCSTMSIAALIVIDRNQKQHRCPSTEEWNHRKCDSYTRWNSIQLLKNKDIMLFAVNWMELKNVILSEVTHTQDDMHVMYSLINGY